MPTCGQGERPFLSVVPKDVPREKISFYKVEDTESEARESEMYGQGRTMQSMQVKARDFAALCAVIFSGSLVLVIYYGAKTLLRTNMSWPLG